MEIAVFYGELHDRGAPGTRGAVSNSRKDLIDMVKEVWQAIDHAAISHTGYYQTGPLFLLRGPTYLHA